jgi:hypothetical protein
MKNIIYGLIILLSSFTTNSQAQSIEQNAHKKVKHIFFTTEMNFIPRFIVFFEFFTQSNTMRGNNNTK